MIWKVPFSIKLIRPSFPRIRWPSFSHWMLGMGLPKIWQCNWVVEPGAKVWLAGPWRMMGGTRSEGAVETESEVRWFEIHCWNVTELPSCYYIIQITFWFKPYVLYVLPKFQLEWSKIEFTVALQYVDHVPHSVMVVLFAHIFYTGKEKTQRPKKSFSTQQYTAIRSVII